MDTSKQFRAALPLLAAAACGLGWAGVAHATNYAGNGATGFGGPVGKGNFAITDDGAGDITFTLTPAATHASVDGNSLVIYISTGAPGLIDTSPLIDNGDSGREAISGYSANVDDPPSSRSLIDFPSNFQANYALSMEGSFVGLFQLPPVGGDGGLSFVTGMSQSSSNLTVTFPLADIGLTQGQSFNFVGTLIDGTAAYRSNETIGATNPDISTGGNPGFNNLITFSTFDTYVTSGGSVPTQWSLSTGSSWNTTGNWTAGIPNAPGAAAIFASTPGLTSSGTVTLDANQTVGTLTFNNSASYTIAQGTAGSLTLDSGGVAAATITDTNGSHSITAPMIFTSNVVATVVNAADTLTLSGAISGTGSLTAVGPGTLSLGANAGSGIRAITISALNLNGITAGKISVGASAATANRTVLITSALNFGGSTGAWTGLLDLTKNDLIIHGGTLASIQNQLKQGLSGTAGITSSAVPLSSSPKTALGFAAITTAGTFDGQSVAASDVVVKYTVSGDADLSGSVNFSDLLTVAQHYNGTNTTWTTGDFNYDGTTNFTDLLALAQNYNKGLSLSGSQLTQLDTAGGSSFAAAFAQAEAQVSVPEPGTLSLLGAAAVGLLPRRRKTV